MDCYDPEEKILWDVKTIADITKAERQYWDLAYDVQMTFYTMALEANGYTVNEIRVLWLETQEPYTVAVSELSDDAILSGHARMAQAFDKWKEQKDLPHPEYRVTKLTPPSYLYVDPEDIFNGDE